MGVNKITLGNRTLLDVTGVTATPSDVLNTKYFVDSDGVRRKGTLSPVATPKLQSKTVTPTAKSQSVTPDSGYDGLSTVTVNAVPTQAKTATPKATTQTIKPDSDKFLSQVTIYGDSNLKAENIKAGETVFGVTGTYEGSSASGLAIREGSFTLTAKATTFTVTGLGFKPKYVVITGTQEPSFYHYESIMVRKRQILDYDTLSTYIFEEEEACIEPDGNTTSSYDPYTGYKFNVTASDDGFTITSIQPSYYLLGTSTYQWTALY